MRVKMKTASAGPEVHHNAGVGHVVDVPLDHARRLVDGGFAEAVDPFPVEEAEEVGGQQLPLGEEEARGRKGRGKKGGAPETTTAPPAETETE